MPPVGGLLTDGKITVVVCCMEIMQWRAESYPFRYPFTALDIGSLRVCGCYKNAFYPIIYPVSDGLTAAVEGIKSPCKVMGCERLAFPRTADKAVDFNDLLVIMGYESLGVHA